MKALLFERKPARYAAARVSGAVVPGRGAAHGPLRLAEIDEPALPAAEWVTVRPRLAGICGSDLATIDGHSSRYFEPIVSFPFVPGHEVVGELDDGRRVVVVPVLHCAIRGIDPPCGACRDGRTNHCERIAFGHLAPGLQAGFCADTGGGWSTRMVAHPDQLVAVPDELTDEAAVLVEPTACAVHAAEAVRTLSPTTVAVLGSGSVGLLTLAAIARLARPGGLLLASAKHPAQRALARSLGADRVVEPSEVARVVRSATGSFVLGGAQLTGGVDCVVDCVGTAASLTDALAVVAPGGTVLLVGMPGHVSVDLTSLWHRESAVRGCYAYSAADFATAVSLVADADLGRLLSATYPLSRYREAIEHAANAGARGSVKIAFDLRDEKERGQPTRSSHA